MRCTNFEVGKCASQLASDWHVSKAVARAVIMNVAVHPRGYHVVACADWFRGGVGLSLKPPPSTYRRSENIDSAPAVLKYYYHPICTRLYPSSVRIIKMLAFTYAPGDRHCWRVGLSFFHVAFTSTSWPSLCFNKLLATSFFHPRCVYNTIAVADLEPLKF